MSGERSMFETPATVATEREATLCQTIAQKYVALCEELGVEPPYFGTTRPIAAIILASHKKREPLRLDVLATYGEEGSHVRMQDFAHDIGGIVRHDEFQSARWAVAYHPPSNPHAPVAAEIDREWLARFDKGQVAPDSPAGK